jgi:hypothetical protein
MKELEKFKQIIEIQKDALTETPSKFCSPDCEVESESKKLTESSQDKFKNKIMKTLYIAISIFFALLVIGFYATRNTDRGDLRPVVNKDNKENNTNK